LAATPSFANAVVAVKRPAALCVVPPWKCLRIPPNRVVPWFVVSEDQLWGGDLLVAWLPGMVACWAASCGPARGKRLSDRMPASPCKERQGWHINHSRASEAGSCPMPSFARVFPSPTRFAISGSLRRCRETLSAAPSVRAPSADSCAGFYVEPQRPWLPRQFLQQQPRAGGVSGASNLWVGAWWNDGALPDWQAGVTAQFAAHPEGGSHHTVPIRIG